MVDREYLNLSVSDRNQRALERFLKSRTKNSYQIGKDYERYIGYLYESKEYKVTYFGIEQGIADLGRDLICKKGGKIEIIQCKYWSSEKKIHEKHINQLFGTTVKYYLEQNRQLSLSQFSKVIENRSITPVFYTTTSLTPTARQFAEALGVVVHEMFPYKPYPVIKCHINKVTGEKIYHLPFDQMYDKTILEKKYNEFYALTVEEAEKQGFRKAWRWSGQ